MTKPTSLKALEQLEKELMKDRRNFEYKEITQKVQEYSKQLYKDNELFLKGYNDKLNEVRKLIGLRRLELKEKHNNKIPKDLQLYISREWESGVDFGYNGISIRYIDPDNKFIIVTSNGGTAGTGTAMGTGSYYYAESNHFVTFPQYGRYLDARMPDHGRSSNNRFEVQGGRLTNEIKLTLIEKAKEFCKQYNVPSFKIENGKLIIIENEK